MRDPNFNCSAGLPDFPIATAYAVGGVVNNIPIICGGGYGTIYDDNHDESIQNKTKKCYKFQAREWKEMEKGIDEPKFYFGTGNLVIKEEEEKFLIHGGLTEFIQDKSSRFADSSEWFGNNTHSLYNDTLPVGGHCNIQINDTHFMVTGGLIPNGKTSKVTNKTYFCHTTNLTKCSPGPSLNIERRAHSCFQKAQYLYVVGGYITPNRTTPDTDVEYLHLGDKNWTVGTYS